MRTRLLKTVYPSTATDSPANDTGDACNEETYATAQPNNTVCAIPAPQPAAANEHDDYYLGGYAGSDS